MPSVSDGVIFSSGAEPSPALLVACTKRRGRKTSKDVPESKETGLKPSEETASKSRGRGRKPKAKPGNLHSYLNSNALFQLYRSC